MGPMRRRDVLRMLGVAPLARAAGVRALDGSRPAGIHDRTQADVELALAAEPGEVQILPGAPTQVWRFTARLIAGPADTIETTGDSYLGPVLRLRRGQRVRVRFRNRIGEPSIVHWHGLDVPELADGHPRLAVGHGAEYVYDFTVDNRAGTYWYHPHPHMRTGAQVNRGLAGLLLVSDPEEDALGLPSGAAEILCVLQDRRFDAGNQILYVDDADAAARGRGAAGRGAMRGRGAGMGGMMDAVAGWLGDRPLVNGRAQPAIDVARRTYRVRVLNGSSARVYKLGWSDGSPMVAIGADGGLLDRPRTMPAVTLAPAQRVDLILDLSRHRGGSTLALRSLPFPAADTGSTGMTAGSSSVPQGAALTLLTLRVSQDSGPRFEVPARLTRDEFDPAASAPVRRVPLTMRQMRWLLGGRVFDLTEVADEEIVPAGATHVWELVNEPNPMGMAMAHPVHLHGRQFRVISRSGGSPSALREGISDAGWLDTVLVLPGETVRLQVTFSRHTGLFLYHCHTLEHEDMGMMRNYRIRGPREIDWPAAGAVPEPRR
jgi:FtsP/CotA-like multicopper oxidase with cupredoxin domain